MRGRGATQACRVSSLTFHNAGEGGGVPGHKNLELLIKAANARVNVPGPDACCGGEGVGEARKDSAGLPGSENSLITSIWEMGAIPAPPLHLPPNARAWRLRTTQSALGFSASFQGTQSVAQHFKEKNQHQQECSHL